MTNWQPIETAPRGSFVILTVEDDDGEKNVVVAFYDETEWEPGQGPGWLFYPADANRRVAGTATHWQPLPKPPGDVNDEEKADRVAKAICNAQHGEDCWDAMTEEVFDSYLVMARGAIDAMRAPEDVEALAQSYLDKADEDWTYVDPEGIKRLARAVLGLDAA